MAADPIAPLFVGLQAPQGAGKTTLARRVKEVLTSSPHSLNLVIFSLDDLYLTHENLVRLAEKHAGNALLKGRGQPGTHDVELCQKILEDLAVINTPGASEVQIPFFDKSLFGGEGDRTTQGAQNIKGPVDVVLLEGWCMGFFPINNQELETQYEVVTGFSSPPDDPTSVDLKKLVGKHTVAQVQVVNDYLREYAEKIYPFFDTMINVGISSGSLLKSHSDADAAPRSLRQRTVSIPLSTTGDFNKNII